MHGRCCRQALLHLVGYLYYWQMGFNSVFKGLNLKYIIAFTVRNMRAGLCFDLKYFPFTLPHTSLKATLFYTDTIYSDPSMTS